MDESSITQNRRQRRSNVLLTAAIEFGGRSMDVRLRNLSAEGALVEADGLPADGQPICFRKGDLCVAGKIVWNSNKRAGIHFDQPLTPEALLRHVPTPRPRMIPEFKRPGLGAKPLTSAELSLEKLWGVAKSPILPGS